MTEQAGVEAPGVAKPGNGSQRWTLISAHLSFFLVLNGSTAPNVSLLPIQQEFGDSTLELSWVINAYTLAFASFLLLAGTLSDRLGARRVFLGGLGLYTLAALACMAAPSLGTLIAAQSLSGLGAAALAPTSLALISHSCPDPARRARAVAAWAATGAVAVAVGPLAGGLLVTQFGWRAMFALYVIGGLVVLAIAVRCVAAVPTRESRGFDPVGQVLAVLALCALTVALVATGQHGWTGPLPLGGFAVAGLMIVGLVLVERTVTTPVIPFELFRDRTFSAAISIGFLVNLAYYGQIFVLSLYFAGAAGYSPLQVGLALLPMTATLGVSNVIVGRLIGRTGPRPLMLGGSVVCAGGLLAMAALGAHASYGQLLLPLLLVGAGCGFVVPSMTTAMLSVVPPSHFGVASGLLNSSRQMGGVIGVALLGSLVSGAQFAEGKRTSEVIAGAALLLVAAATARYVRRK